MTKPTPQALRAANAIFPEMSLNELAEVIDREIRLPKLLQRLAIAERTILICFEAIAECKDHLEAQYRLLDEARQETEAPRHET